MQLRPGICLRCLLPCIKSQLLTSSRAFTVPPGKNSISRILKRQARFEATHENISAVLDREERKLRNFACNTALECKAHLVTLSEYMSGLESFTHGALRMEIPNSPELELQPLLKHKNVQSLSFWRVTKPPPFTNGPPL